MKRINAVKDLTGQRFGRLTVVGIAETGTRKTFWVCQCDCGNMKTVRSDSLQCGAIRSCGCLKKEQDHNNLGKNKTHGQSNTRIYYEWQDMKKRCQSPKNSRYARYGGRGIKVCEEWDKSFDAFYKWAIENGYNEELTIDRIDNDGNYEPSNCRFITVKEQCRNRSTNIKIKIGNTTKSLIEWCEIFDLNYAKIHGRYERHPNINIADLFNG